MFETLTITSILLTLFFLFQNQRLGLTAAVPTDPNTRVQFYASECLGKLKNLLPHSRIQKLEDHALSFIPKGEQQPQQLSVVDGKVTLGASAPVSYLGPEGELSFEQLSATGLLVTIVAKTPEAAHRVALRLDVEFSA